LVAGSSAGLDVSRGRPSAAGVTYFDSINQNGSGNWKIDEAQIWFNLLKHWNTNLDFGTGVYDIRKAARHELGHAEGLGHVSDSTVAVMRQGATSFYTIQQDDQDSIVALYGAYP